MQVRFLASLSGLGIWHCHELWCRLQARLRSCIAVAVVQAGSCCSNSAPGLGAFMCRGRSPKKTKKPFVFLSMLSSHISLFCQEGEPVP